MAQMPLIDYRNQYADMVGASKTIGGTIQDVTDWRQKEDELNRPLHPMIQDLLRQAHEDVRNGMPGAQAAKKFNDALAQAGVQSADAPDGPGATGQMGPAAPQGGDPGADTTSAAPDQWKPDWNQPSARDQAQQPGPNGLPVPYDPSLQKLSNTDQWTPDQYSEQGQNAPPTPRHESLGGAQSANGHTFHFHLGGSSPTSLSSLGQSQPQGLGDTSSPPPQQQQQQQQKNYPPLTVRDRPDVNMILNAKQHRDYMGEIAARGGNQLAVAGVKEAGATGRTGMVTDTQKTISTEQTGAKKEMNADDNETKLTIAKLNNATRERVAAQMASSHIQAAREHAKGANVRVQADALKSADAELKSIVASKDRILADLSNPLFSPQQNPAANKQLNDELKKVLEAYNEAYADVHSLRQEVQQAQTAAPRQQAKPPPSFTDGKALSSQPEPPQSSGGQPTPTGRIKTDLDGVQWERMSDGTARQVP